MSINDFVEITIFLCLICFSIYAKNQPITLSHTVSKKNACLHFMQNFKMAAKTGGENNFWKEMSDDSADNLGVKNFIEITLSFLHFLQNFKMADRYGEKTF